MNEEQMKVLQDKDRTENDKTGKNWKTKNVDKSTIEVFVNYNYNYNNNY